MALMVDAKLLRATLEIEGVLGARRPLSDAAGDDEAARSRRRSRSRFR